MKASLPGTACITGAGSGIGAGFSRALALRGYDVLLIDIRKDDLAGIAAEIRNLATVRVETRVADLTDRRALDEIARELSERNDLTMFINNAGLGSQGPFAEIGEERMTNILHLNVVAVSALCRAAVSNMARRGHGALINVASLIVYSRAAKAPPLYFGTKAFIYHFTRALAAQMRGSGLRFQVLCPGFTRSRMLQQAGWNEDRIRQVPALFWMEPDRVAERSLNALEKGRLVCIPHRAYRLPAYVAQYHPVAGLLFFVSHKVLSLLSKFVRPHNRAPGA